MPTWSKKGFYHQEPKFFANKLMSNATKTKVDYNWLGYWAKTSKYDEAILLAVYVMLRNRPYAGASGISMKVFEYKYHPNEKFRISWGACRAHRCSLFVEYLFALFGVEILHSHAHLLKGLNKELKSFASKVDLQWKDYFISSDFRTRQRNPPVFTLAELAAHVSSVIMLSSPSKYKTLRGAKNRKNNFDWLVFVKKFSCMISFSDCKNSFQISLIWVDIFDIKTRFIYTSQRSPCTHLRVSYALAAKVHVPTSTEFDFFFVFQMEFDMS